MDARVYTFDVPLRKTPSAVGKIIARLNIGHELRVLKSNEWFWCKVATMINEQVVVGYIASVLIDIPDGAESYMEISHGN